MKKFSVIFEDWKSINDLTFHELNCLLDHVYDELLLFQNCLIDYVENEDDLCRLAHDSGYADVYDCALELLVNYGIDRGKVDMLCGLGSITPEHRDYLYCEIDSTIDFVKRFIRESAIWKG